MGTARVSGDEAAGTRACGGWSVHHGQCRPGSGRAGYIELPSEFAGTAQYAVRIKGHSMEGRRLFDGDLALVDQRQPVREDDVVAVIAEDEQTDDMKANVKIFARRDGVAWLLSANSA